MRNIIRRGLAVLLVAIGAALLIGGAALLYYGGSPYYVLAGIAVTASGALAWRGDARAGVLYGIFLLVTLAWSVWEAGLDGWALAPRLCGPAVVGAGFLLLGRQGVRDNPVAWPSIFRRPALRFVVGALLAIAAGSLARILGPADEPDPMYQAGVANATSSPQLRTVAQVGGAVPGEWRNWGNDPGGSRFSTLQQIAANNVSGLEVAWQVHLGAHKGGERLSLEGTPLKIGDSLYTCTGYNDVLSLDAETGRVNWRFVANVNLKGRMNGKCRGVAYYAVPGQSGLCAERILTNTIDARLLALDSRTGRRCPGFGTDGEVDLRRGMGDVDLGYYYVTSAPTLIGGKVVLGGWVNDNQYWGEPSGVIRAFDAVTGAFVWAFDVGRPGEHGEPKLGETYTHSTPNSWAPMSADPSLNLVYVPTGNATPDYYGVHRRQFDERYSSSVVALDASKGTPRWVFQTTHHDLWDYDVPSQPTLVDIPTGTTVQRALIQPTKRGEIFLLDRVTGKPLATVTERPVPQGGAVPGEWLSPTQPFSTGMPSFSGPRWLERDMWGLTPLDQLWCRIRFRQARYGGTMTPPGVTPFISYPGYYGGVNWGSVSVDPERSVMIVNSSRVGNWNRLLPRAVADAMGIAPSKAGSPRAVGGVSAQAKTPYAVQATPFLSPLGVPCSEPPYGMIGAVDLRTRKLLWGKRFGSAASSGPFGMHSGLPFSIGLPNAGGALTTHSGLIFIGATQEPVFRAIDVLTGRTLWSTRLPAGGQSIPMTYWSAKSQRQFVVLSAGGSRILQSPEGDSLIAFALPRTKVPTR